MTTDPSKRSFEDYSEAADYVNDAVAAGRDVAVNGRPARPRYRTSRTAQVWGNGTFSFSTPARTTNGYNDVWVKDGAVEVEVRA